MAFSRPGGEKPVHMSGRPIDLEHLSRQTMGNRALEQEVLAMFSHQLGTMRDAVEKADMDERRRLGHTLKGSARGVGAFAIGDCAALIEADPASRKHLATLRRLIDETRDFIAAISR